MRYYKIEGLTAVETQAAEQDGDRRSRYERAGRIEIQANAFNRKQNKDTYFFVSSISSDAATLGVITNSLLDLNTSVSSFLKAVDLSLTDIHTEEISFEEMRNLLKMASRHSFIEDNEAVLKRFDLDELDNWHKWTHFGENLIDDEESPESVYGKAEKLLVKGTLISEMDRICAGQNTKRAAGHPVHYLVCTDDRNVRRETCKILLQTLYGMNRVFNRRYCFTDIHPDDDIELPLLDQLYNSNKGGAMIIRYIVCEGYDQDQAGSGIQNIEMVCELMKKYRHQVLTILCLPRVCKKEKELFFEYLGNISFVEIEESFAKDEAALGQLKMMAKEIGVRADKDLADRIEPGVGYLTSDLRTIFEEWYNNKLKTIVFPQYKEVATVSRTIQKEGPAGNAYEELMNMIGLTEAKKVIDRAIKYRKAQKLFADKGMKADHPSMHMVFSGSPGTAKTTVARLFARIMKDNGLLSIGHLVEVGRGDLVGKYVGWTAKTVQEKFRKAKGGVLFIDEAYSLVDDRNGSYGDEAINTIVQEIENHRDELVVIFAGYTDKMEEFLNKNPGLRSRIAYHVPFPDYSTEELCEIAKLTAAEKGLVLSEGAQGKLTQVFDLAKTQPDFGNGRYVRNIIEKSRMAQTERLLSKDPDKVTRREIATLCEEDIELPETRQAERRTIGFC